MIKAARCSLLLFASVPVTSFRPCFTKGRIKLSVQPGDRQLHHLSSHVSSNNEFPPNQEEKIEDGLRNFSSAGEENSETDLSSTIVVGFDKSTEEIQSHDVHMKDKLGEYNPRDRLPGRKEEVLVGDPQKKVEKEMSVTSILKELSAIQEQGPQKFCVLGTRHCSYLHQRVIELLAYALVLSGNHVYTSGAGGTHAATIRGALRAERPDLLTVVLPQSLIKQPKESQELLKEVNDIIEMPQNDELSLDIASRICNSYMLSHTDHLISFAFHESKTVIEATREARDLDMLVTTLFLD